MHEAQKRRQAAENRRRRMVGALVGHARELLSQLDTAEKTSLLGLKPRLMKRSVPKDHEAKFIALSLADRKLGGLMLTPVGEIAAGLLSDSLL